MTASTLFVVLGGLGAVATIEVERGQAAGDDCDDTGTPGVAACAVPGPNLALAGAVGTVAGAAAAGLWLITAGRSTRDNETAAEGDVDNDEPQGEP